MSNVSNQIISLIEMLSDKDMFLCESNLQARTMSEGFVQEAVKLQKMVETLERDLLVEQRRYSELMEHRNELAKEVQCARMTFESLTEKQA